MAPKADYSELKKSIDTLIEEVATIKEQQKTIMSLVVQLDQMRADNLEKDKKIAILENRVADIEQYTRINDVIITGLSIKPRSYARAVAPANGGEPAELDVISMERQVAVFMQSKDIQLDCNSIEACHLLPRRGTNDKPSVVLRFVNRKHKIALLKQGRKLKGTNIYMNDHLTKRNADIARKARQMRREKKILQTWTANCKVFIKLNGTPENAKVLLIRNIEDLNEYDV
ncbi:uncharacterized protein LOC133655823 [Entelurus aequoreus]|uniref:uncharacterized protein LOC133655823 n=1 Tax=Entelurus aequoreus TaxID=161455 RepID=UPI002B1E6E06|nr:uncharacterized protein LOC133655823 [Entelurus aequoreus]